MKYLTIHCAATPEDGTGPHWHVQWGQGPS